jgi:hypothetical protein
MTVHIVGVGIEASLRLLSPNKVPEDLFEAGFEYAECCVACRRPCKMHFSFIFAIFAFQGVHGSHF